MSYLIVNDDNYKVHHHIHSDTYWTTEATDTEWSLKSNLLKDTIVYV